MKKRMMDQLGISSSEYDSLRRKVGFNNGGNRWLIELRIIEIHNINK